MTETLAQKVCTPCRGGIPPLPPDEVARYARQLQDWAVKDDARRIERTYRFGNFREIVIFRGDPEDGDRFRVALSQASGKFHCRESFIDCVKRTSEQTCLLTGDDRDEHRSRLVEAIDYPLSPAGVAVGIHHSIDFGRLGFDARHQG